MSKEDVRGGATARGATEESGHVRIIEGRKSEEITQSNTFSPRGSEVPLSPRGVMAIEVPQNKEISGEGKNGGTKRSRFWHPSEKSE